jgi:hypothetical protein
VVVEFLCVIETVEQADGHKKPIGARFSTYLQKRKKLRQLLLRVANYKSPSTASWSEFLATDPEARVRFPTLPDFLGVEEGKQ